MTKSCDDIFVGETVQVRDETRTVVSIGKNINQDPIILWEAGRSSKGACMPSRWREWRNGKPS
jgi:hypothetical protein